MPKIEKLTTAQEKYLKAGLVLPIDSLRRKSALALALILFSLPVQAEGLASVQTKPVDFNKPIQFYHKGTKYNLLCKEPTDKPINEIGEKGEKVFKSMKCKILSTEKENAER